MFKIPALCGAALLCFALSKGDAQSVDSAASRVSQFPSRLLGRIQRKISNLNTQLSSQTQRYLRMMARQEGQMQQKLAGVDSAGAKQLFAGSAQQYAALSHRVQSDSGKAGGYSGVYPPYLDSLQGSMKYLQQNPQLLSSQGQLAEVARTNSSLQALQGKMGDADAVKAYIQQRKQQIGQYLAQHGNVQGLLGSRYAGMNKEVYYYSQTLRQYKEMWNNPDAMEQQALSLMNKLPAFQTFMKNNSMLGNLFNVPGGYGTAQGVAGLQTRSQVSGMIQGQLSAAGPGGATALQSNLSTAESSLDNYKSKLSALGAGNGDGDMPDFKPNDQKTKTFWKRLEYGANFQTEHTDYYYPTVTDFGASLAYKLGHDNLLGIGASYKLGWGNGIQHIAFSSQGVGLRSFVQIRIKGSFSATGGFEYNYTTPFANYQQLKQLQYWTKSGLIGVTKTVSMKNRVFKKTTLSLLWDFLSYEQVPQTEPFVFRIGYSF